MEQELGDAALCSFSPQSGAGRRQSRYGVPRCRSHVLSALQLALVWLLVSSNRRFLAQVRESRVASEPGLAAAASGSLGNFSAGSNPGCKVAGGGSLISLPPAWLLGLFCPARPPYWDEKGRTVTQEEDGDAESRADFPRVVLWLRLC